MEPENKKTSGVVETYAEDMAKVIEDDKEGLVKKIIHGEEERERAKMNLSPESKKNKFFLLLGVLLVLSALVILAYFLLQRNNNTVPVTPQSTPLIFNDQNTYLEVSGLKKDQIAQSVLNEMSATKAPSGGVEGIYLTENKQVIGLRRFRSLIQSNFAPDSNPILVSDNFLLGVANTGAGSVASNTTPGFFMLIKVRSVSDIFDALRAWEPSMLSDLHGFLGIDSSDQNKYLFTKSFEDGIVENKNARELYDNNGNLVLMYVFADDNSVVIASSQEAAQLIMLRLASGETNS